MREDIKSFITSVAKPGRYTGGELGSVFKNKDEVDLRVAFCFPDTYEIGMSNLGMRILCHCFNSMDRVWCERAYAPWVDMEEEMRNRGIPLFAHESGDPVSDFDIVAFTLQYELCYSNVLNMLDLSGIPLRSADRTDDDPIVIAGGHCAYNPEPMADFIDIFSIGEGEEALPELAELWMRMKRDGSYTRERFLYAAATELKGFYVPSLYEISYKENGSISAITPKNGAPKTVVKRVIEDLDKAAFPTDQIMPYIDTVHDRVTVEVFRGCIRGCRFCQAGFICRPVREKSPEVLTEQAKAMCEATGYDEISLCSLSISDYSKIGTLTDNLLDWTDDARINLSLPSLRADTFTKELMDKISSVRSSAVTFAPEAGTQRLRDVINKNVTEEEILKAASVAYGAGKNRVKLYFMNGLPCERDEDVEGIASVAAHVVDEYYKTPNRNKKQQPQVTLSVACFIPKPHTPFQWEGQNSFEELERKQALLSSNIKDRKIRYNYHDAKVSHLEAVFARGDRRLADALELACRKHIRFDAWEEFFDLDRWLEIFEECGIDPKFYACRTIPDDEILPWDMIDCGVSKDFLIRERRRAYEAATTPNCREACSGCGVNKLADPRFCRWCPGHPGGNEIESITGNEKKREALVGDDLIRERQKTNPKPVRSVRVRFAKTGSLLYISHLDLAKTVSKIITRSGLPVWYTEGFNPIPHLVFSPPLPLGSGGESEVLDFKLVSQLTDEEIKERLIAVSPPDLEIKEVYEPTSKLKTIAWAENVIEFKNCVIENSDILAASINSMFSSPVVIMKRSKSGEREVDIAPLIKTVSCKYAAETGDNTDASIKDVALIVNVVTSASGENYLNPEYVAKAIEEKFHIQGSKGYHTIIRRDFLTSDGSKFR